MKIHHLQEGVGRIVKGVNTTPDVGPDEIKTQAAKFGNTVDKDGRPPSMSSKVKGKSTNVLFNLGLTEGIKLRLERDKHIDVLHIQDTNEKHRVEVRGKKGYETDGYDPMDKLHQVLDRVGKAANISDLMNGEVVHINPGHPQGSRAIRTAKDVLQTEQKYTNYEIALMEGGHSLDDYDKPTPTVPELAKKHNVPVKHILQQLEMGIEAEYEHTSDFEVAKEIALDHIAENPNYYDRLKFIEAEKHTVASGDTLWGLSQEYGVSVEDLRSWNGLDSNTVRLGQELFVSEPDQPDHASPRPQMRPASFFNSHERTLIRLAKQAGIEGNELAHLLAHCAHETRDWTRFVEEGSPNSFNDYENLYGNDTPGDGYRYRGRGYLQLTFKSNYRDAGEALGMNLVDLPEMVERPFIGAQVAIWYWLTRVRRRASDILDVRQVTRIINGGLNGLQDRKNKYQRYSNMIRLINQETGEFREIE